MRLVGAAGALVVALALVLTAAPGAHAPSTEATLATLSAGDLAERIRDVTSRAGERTPLTEAAEPEPATSSASTSPSPQPQAAPTPEPVAPEPAAPAAPAAAPEVPVPDAGAALSAEVVDLTNAQRAVAGLPALGVSPCATEQAVQRTTVLVAEGRFEHDPLRPVIEACAAGTVGENLSLGYASAQDAVDGWMASPGHRENILRDGYTELGVACAQGDRGWLCAQVFVG